MDCCTGLRLQAKACGTQLLGSLWGAMWRERPEDPNTAGGDAFGMAALHNRERAAGIGMPALQNGNGWRAPRIA